LFFMTVAWPFLRSHSKALARSPSTPSASKAFLQSVMGAPEALRSSLTKAKGAEAKARVYDCDDPSSKVEARVRTALDAAADLQSIMVRAYVGCGVGERVRVRGRRSIERHFCLAMWAVVLQWPCLRNVRYQLAKDEDVHGCVVGGELWLVCNVWIELWWGGQSRGMRLGRRRVFWV